MVILKRYPCPNVHSVHFVPFFIYNQPSEEIIMHQTLKINHRKRQIKEFLMVLSDLQDLFTWVDLTETVYTGNHPHGLIPGFRSS